MNLKIDMIALNDIYKQNPLFGFEILKNHKPIIINNQEKYIEFKTKCQLYYLDAKPLIEQNRASLKQRIANNKFGERDFARQIKKLRRQYRNPKVIATKATTRYKR